MSVTGYDHNKRSEILEFIPMNCQRLLEVGCHAGTFGATVKSTRGSEVWGVEPNESAAELARKCLDHVVVGFFDEGVKVPDNYFDVIVFNDVIEHIPQSDEAIRLAKTKLRENGVIVCSIPNMRHIDNLEHLLFEKDWRYEDSGIRDRTHLRFFTRVSMIRLFEESGFQVENIVGINPSYWKKEKLLRRILFRIFRSVTEDLRYIQYAIVARPIIEFGNCHAQTTNR